MLNLKKILKPYTETGALNEQINLYGFVDQHAFLTKSGDVGVILQVHGVDYECLDGNSLDTLTKRLESALQALRRATSASISTSSSGINETIPHKKYANPIVNTAIENRIRHFEQKADKPLLTSGFLRRPLRGLPPQAGLLVRWRNFTRILGRRSKICWPLFHRASRLPSLDTRISKALATLHQKVKSFILAGQRLRSRRTSSEAGGIPSLEADAQFRATEARTRPAQTRYVSRLLPLRIAPRMPSRASSPRRLLR